MKNEYISNVHLLTATIEVLKFNDRKYNLEDKPGENEERGG